MIRQSQPDEVSAPDMPSGLLYADILRGAWRRKARVLLGLLLGVAVGALCWSHWPRTYESRMQLLVVKRKTPDAQVAGISPQLPEFEDYLSAQKALLSSPLIVSKALQDGQLQRLKSLEAEDDPTTAIIAGLTVTRDSADRSRHALLTLTYRGPVPEDCRAVIEAIVASYKRYLAETGTSAAAEVESLCTQWKSEVQEVIARKQDAYRALRDTAAAAEWTGKDGMNLSESRLAQLEAERLHQTVQRAELQGRLSALAQAREADASQQELIQMISHWSEPWPAPVKREAEVAQKVDVALHEQLVLLRLEERSLPESYGPGHPQVKALREQTRLAEQIILGRSDVEASDAPTPGPGAGLLTADPVRTYSATLQKDIQVATELEQTLSELTRREQDCARQINDLNEDMGTLRAEIASAEQLQQQIAQQLQGLRVFHDSDVYHAQVISPAQNGLLVAPQPRLLFPVAALFGLFVGGVLAYAVEVSDKSFRSPAEIREHLRLPVIGHTEYYWTRHRNGRQAGQNGRYLAPVLCTHFAPDSAESEEYRRVRSMVCLNGNGRPKSVIQITSPNRGDGRSTVAANLAVSMAQMGRRVVLVDADFRRPSLHGIFGVSNEIGIASVLSGQADLSDALRSTSVEKLSLLPCEAVPPESHELLSRGKFERLLDELRSKFDFVLIDTPPVLGASDGCVVAHHADVVLLTLRNSKHARPLAEEAVQTLTDQEARLLGVVVNNPSRGSSRNHGYATSHRSS